MSRRLWRPGSWVGAGINNISQHLITFKVHKQSAEIVIYHGRVVGARPGGNARENIKEFSYKSERRMRLLLEDTVHLYKHIIILTYPADFPLDGKKVKRDLRAIIKWLRRQGINTYFWGLEFQKRGAAHINFLTPPGVDEDKLKKAWHRIVGSEDLNHRIYGVKIEEIRDTSALSTYLIGYVKKKEQKEVPEEFKNVGRWWGSTESLKSSGRFTKRFESEEALNEYIKPVIAFHEGRLKEWSEKSKKSYKWQYRGNSFTLWGGADVVNKFIEGGVCHE